MHSMSVHRVHFSWLHPERRDGFYTVAMPTDTPINPSHCPLCGQPNQCAISAGLPPNSCWCMQTPVSPDALERLPADARGKACICPACARPVADDSTSA